MNFVTCGNVCDNNTRRKINRNTCGIVAVKGDPSLPSSYVFGATPRLQTVDYNVILFEKINRNSQRLSIDISKILGLDDQTEIELDIECLTLLQFRDLEILCSKPLPRKFPETIQELAAVANETKRNTEEALSALKNELNRLNGKVVPPSPLLVDPGAELRKSLDQLAQEELRKEEEESSSN